MVASRIRAIGAFYPARLLFSVCCIALMPTSIGYQDLAALLAHGPSAGVDWHMIASPFGTVEAATFHYTRPIGSAIPEPLGLFQNVNFDPRSLDAFAWKIDEPIAARPARQVEYPMVNRANKGDRLPASNAAPAPPDPARLPQLQPISAPDGAPAIVPTAPQPASGVAPRPKSAEDTSVVPSTASQDAREDEAAAWAPRGSDDDTVPEDLAPEDLALEDKPPELPAPGETDADKMVSSLDQLSFLNDAAGDRSAQIYFGNGAMGAPSSLQTWSPGAEPVLIAPSEPPGLRLAALEVPDAGADDIVAGKDNSRLLSPAQQLGLQGKPRMVAEKCLADAVYFEARGEVVKGQEAVAQVVMNRVFSGVYPHDVCGVVYQNAGRHLACQFTFACEGKDLNKIDEPDMWEQAKRISKDMLDGKIWLAEVGHATHYHAYWVHPSWVHEMARLYHLGVHTFYRPLNWGSGDDEPVWGKGPANVGVRLDPEVLNEDPTPAPRNFDAAAKGPQAAVTPDKSEPIAKL